MFDSLTKAILEVKERDEERLQRRKSKRISSKYAFDENGKLIEYEEEPNENPENEGIPRRITRASVAPSVESDLEEDDDDLIEDRDKWENDYIGAIHMIAFAVGGSNIWRFGYLCYTHGGILFLIPYTLLSLVCALPCVYLELLVGQYAQVGAIAAWKIAPIFKGVGMCMILLAFMSVFNIQTMLAWCVFYIFQTVFHNPLPWVSCDNGFGKKENGQNDETKVKWVAAENGEEQAKNWHTERCVEFFPDSEEGSLGQDELLPGSEYFRGRVQRMWKSGFADSEDKEFKEDNGKIMFGLYEEDEGGLAYNTDTLVCLLVVIVIIEIFISRGIKPNAKMMVILTLFPYVWLVLLFYRATGLSGAWEGLGELFAPDASKLWDSETWRRCAEQVFYSTGAGFGIHLTCGSHNRFTRRVVYDAIAVVSVDALTSILSACTIFMYLGHVSYAVNRELKVFVKQGPMLVFEVMSDVLGVLAKANFYAFSFYLFIFLLALTTVTTTLVCAKSSYSEVLPLSIKYRTGARLMLMTLIISISFIVSSLNLTRGGLHTFNFINTFTGLYTLVLCAVLFLTGISWCYGLRELVDATTAMGIRAPGIYFQICWKFISPIVLTIVFLGLVNDSRSHDVTYEDKSIPLGIGLHAVGFTIALGPFLVVFVGAIHAYWKAPGKNSKEKWLTCISPTKEHNDILATGTGKRAKLSHYFYFYAPTPGGKFNLFCSFGKTKVAPEKTVSKTEETKDKSEKVGGYDNVNDYEPIVLIVPQVHKIDETQSEVSFIEKAEELRLGRGTKEPKTPENINPEKTTEPLLPRNPTTEEHKTVPSKVPHDHGLVKHEDKKCCIQ